MVTWSNPAAASCRTMTSRMGNSPIGISGFGNTTVYGRRRVPRPPARITARLDIVDFNLVPSEILRASQPFDCLRQALFQRDFGTKPGQCRDPGVVAPETVDLAAFRTNTCVIRYDGNLRSQKLLNQDRDVADRDFRIGADIDRLSD